MVRVVVVVVDMTVALEQVEHGEVGRRLAVGHGGTLEYRPPLRVVGVDELVDQARLPHAGLPDHGDDLAMPRPGLLQRLLQGRQLLLPSHEAGEPTRRCGLQAPADRTGPRQLKDLHGLGQPPDGKLSQGVDLHEALGQPEGRGSQPDTPRGRELLHTRGQMRGLADGGIVHMQVVANRPHHDFPGVEPDAHLHLQTVGAAHLLGIAPHRRLHGQASVTGPHGVIFVRHGRPEQGHDAIAQHLVHRPFKAVHGVHHALQRRIEECLGRFRIKVTNQFGRPFEVGKQHGDLFALAFQGTSGGEDLLDQIGWGVRQRRRRCGWRRRGGGRRGRYGSAGPDQDCTVFITRQALALDEFVLQIFEGRVVELELPLQGAVGQASPTLEHGDRLVENLLKGHCPPSRSR